jgi:hypothetical protein
MTILVNTANALVAVATGFLDQYEYSLMKTYVYNND